MINFFLKLVYLVIINWFLFRINNIINGIMLILFSVLLLSLNDYFFNLNWIIWVNIFMIEVMRLNLIGVNVFENVLIL